jgi:hypothetical protein
VAELKSRPALLGACTSCPVLHEKIDEMHARFGSRGRGSGGWSG